MVVPKLVWIGGTVMAAMGGTYLVMNPPEREGLRIVWYQDSDGDKFGNSDVKKKARKQPSGYVADSTDCNDTDSLFHPFAVESCNNIDDNCSGTIDEGLTQFIYYADRNGDGYGDNAADFIQSCNTVPPGYSVALVPIPDVVITTGTVSLNRNLWWWSDIDNWFDRHGAFDVTSEPYYSRVKNLQPYGIVFAGGTVSLYDSVMVHDTVAIGGTGSGYNCEKWGPEVLNGDCMAQHLLNGKKVDAFNSHCALIRKLGCRDATSINVYSGSLSQMNWKNQRTKPDFNMFGQETNNQISGTWNVHEYLNRARAWRPVNSIADAAPIWSRTKKNVEWNDSLAKADAKSNLFNSFRCYTQWDLYGKGNGDITHDTSMLTSGFVQMRNDFEAMLTKFNKPISITQFLLSDAYNPGGYDVHPGEFLSGIFLFKGHDFFQRFNRDHNPGIAYCIWHNFKNSSDTSSVKYKIGVQLGNMYSEDAVMLNTIDSPVPMFGERTNSGVYKLFIYNYTGVPIPLPKTLLLDGYFMAPVWSGNFLYCNELTSKALYKYVPEGTIKGFSTAYCEIRIPTGGDTTGN